MRSPASVRLFIALWPPDPVRDAIAQWQSQWKWSERARPVRPERLHVTLHFLGAVPPSRVRDLEYVLQQIPTPGFDLHFGRPEIWPQGIAVLRPTESPMALRGMQGRIGLALGALGMNLEERAYRAHVTLARRAGGAQPPARDADIHWPARDGFVLVQTLGGGRGYEVLHRFGGRGAAS
jgi:2'-5' RNA ligase